MQTSKTMPVKWTESATGFSAQTSFGFAHINKEDKTCSILGITGTRNNFYKNITNVAQLKARVEELHLSTINKALQYVY